MAKLKTGLHKDISAIFDGVPLPERSVSGSGNQTSVGTSSRETIHRVAAKPSSSLGQAPASKTAYSIAKPPSANRQKPAVKKAEADDEMLSENVFHRLQAWAKTALAGGRFSCRKAVEVVVLGGLLIFLAVRVFAVVSPSSVAADEQAVADEQQDKAFDGNVDWQFPEPYAAGLRDPMVLEETAATKLTGPDALEVKGVLHSKDNSFAIIGIEIAKIGDVVSGATIMKIDNNSVTFKKDERVWTQKIHR